MSATNYIMVKDRMTLTHSAFSGIIPGSPDHPSLEEFSHIYPSCHRREALSLLLTFWPLVTPSAPMKSTQERAEPKSSHFQSQSKTQTKKSPKPEGI